MESHRYLSFLLMVLMCFLYLSEANTHFYVGGKDGWVLKPSENYNHWAERIRFQVNDSLIFKYKKGSDSVVVVSKNDYNECNKTKPKRTLEGGDSAFKFHRSGPFFFISGHGDNCKKGQKLMIVVLAVRNITHKAPTPTPLPSPSPAPKVPTPAPSIAKPPPPSPSPAAKPPSKAESPKVESPKSTAPEHPPVFDAPAPAPAPSASQAFGGSGGFVLGLSYLVLGCFFRLI